MTLFAVADFCLIPMGTPSPSVGIYIAECQRVLEGMRAQGIKYEVRWGGALMCRTHLETRDLGCGGAAADTRTIRTL